MNFTKTIPLPSEGKCYPENSQLASGTLEVKYMTAQQDDILQDTALLRSGEVVDTLLKSMLVVPTLYEQLVLGDQDALMYAARYLGPGPVYEFETVCPKCGEVEQHAYDIENELKFLPVRPELSRDGGYEFELPVSKRIVTYKLMTIGDNQKVQSEIIRQRDALGKSPTVTARLRETIISVDSIKERSYINDFVSNEFLVRDSRAFQKEVNSMMPSVDDVLKFKCEKCGHEWSQRLPMDLVNFFYPSED